MKKIPIIGLLLLILTIAAFSQGKKLWVTNEWHQNGTEVLFIEDIETGTRCYVVTNTGGLGAGYAISCIPRGK